MKEIDFASVAAYSPLPALLEAYRDEKVTGTLGGMEGRVGAGWFGFGQCRARMRPIRRVM